MFDSISTAKEEHVAPMIEELAIPHSQEEDAVGDQYCIQLNTPIPELSNDFTRYYLATQKESNEEFYAIVFERSFVPDYKLIHNLMHSAESCFIKPLAVSLTKLSTSKVKHLAVIVEKYDYKNNLSANYEKIGLNNNDYLVSELLPFLCNVIEFCDSNNINCGNINPNNILIIGNKFLLREPYIAYPHYYQTLPYLATELFDTHEAGRKSSTMAPDIFAIGVTLISTYFNSFPYKDSLEKLKHDRLNQTSFLATIGKKRLPEEIKTHIKGCLNDNVCERWKLQNLQDWQNGKITFLKNNNLIESSEIFAAVSFNGQNYDHYRALASALYNQWDLGLLFLSEERVLKWIQRGVGKSKIIEHLEELTSREYSSYAYPASTAESEDRLSKAILALDNQGPIRINGFGAHFTSLANMFLYSYAKQRKDFLNIIIKISVKKTWEDIQKYNPKEIINPNMVDLLVSMSQFFNNITPGFGMERVLYHLNPSLPCLSPIVYNEYITRLSDLISHLDKLASTAPEKVSFDKHILSFIAHRIGLKRDIFINAIKNFPNQPENSTVYGLAILVLASSEFNEVSLKNLANLFGKRMQEFIDKNLHNVKLKKTLEAKIKVASTEGDLAEILKITSNAKIYQNDQSGYYKACRDVNLINKKIKSLNNTKEIMEYGNLFGQRITVLLSYLLFIIILLFMVV